LTAWVTGTAVILCLMGEAAGEPRGAGEGGDMVPVAPEVFSAEALSAAVRGVGRTDRLGAENILEKA